MNKFVFTLTFIVASVLEVNSNQIHGYRCPSNGCQSPKDCLFSNSRNCNMFIQCTAAGLAYEMHCSTGLEWNNELKVCDWPQSANCKPPQWPSKFICPTKDIARTGCKGAKDCLYTNTRDCSTYIQCTVNADGKTGTSVVRPCSPGLKWNDRIKICERPSAATCRWG